MRVSLRVSEPFHDRRSRNCCRTAGGGLTDGRVRQDGSEFNSSAAKGSHDRSQGLSKMKKNHTRPKKKLRRKSNLKHPHRVRKYNCDLCKCRTSNRPVRGDNAKQRSSREYSAQLIISCIPTVPGESRESLIKKRRQTNDYKAVAARPLNDFVYSLFRRCRNQMIFPPGPTREQPI